MLCLLYGCQEHTENQSGFTYDVIIIDDCEYIWDTEYYQGGITHKGNCKNH